ncbi:hypothetical protein ABIA31_004017 [Catenulispora sp. MAP5-51]|uniref:hypothetical protein n=1 Tax=Catenulispora sp. MAP5-51 TaxID=3156298 RepID=UPI003513BFBE
MPENLVSALEALVADGRERIRPLPEASVVARGRSRQRRQRLTVVTSAVGVVAVTAGLAMGITGSGSAAPANPVPTPVPKPVVAPLDASLFLAGPDLPDESTFQWKVAPNPGRTDDGLEYPICGTGGAKGPVTALRAERARTFLYSSTETMSDSSETLYQYPSEAAARADYTALVPDAAVCAQHPIAGSGAGGDDGRLTASTTDGFAWVQTAPLPGPPAPSMTQHIMVVLSGTTIGVYGYVDSAEKTMPQYNTADDPQALARMAASLRNPGSGQVSGPAPAPSSAFLAAAQIPFGTGPGADHGWTQLPVVPAVSGKAAAVSLCGSDFTDVVGGVGSTEATRAFEAPTGPAGAAGPDAHEVIHSFPDARSASAAFTQAQKLIGPQQCHKSDPGGMSYDYSVAAGVVIGSGYSTGINDGTAGTTHEFIVVKGTYVAQLTVIFSNPQPAGARGDTAQILAQMAARLP